MRIVVCPAAHLAEVATEFRPDLVLSFHAPGRLAPPAPGAMALGPGLRKILSPVTGRGRGGAERRPGEGESAIRTGRAPSPCPLPVGERVFAPAAAAVRHAGTVRHLAFAFNDIAEPRPGLVAPDRATVAAILAAGAAAGSVLVSCELGISRSPAVAYALACQDAPHLSEADLAASLRSASACATPNRLIVALADSLLGREGRMIAAVAALGRGADYEPYRAFALTTDSAARSGAGPRSAMPSAS